MIAVVDASVAIKWFLAEEHDNVAFELAREIGFGSLEMSQPAHFVAEVSAVLARLRPQEALVDMQALLALDFERVDDDEIYAVAADLAIRLDHHLFDTLYHAVALTLPSATLVTADRRYYEKARGQGKLTMLSDWAK